MIAPLALPVAALLLALTAAIGNGAAGAVVLVSALVAAVVAPSALGVRAGQGITIAVGLAGSAGVALAWAEGARATGRPDTLEHLVPALAIVVPLAGAAMLMDRGDRRDLLTVLALAVVLGALAVLGAAWLALDWSPVGSAGVAIAGAAIAAAALVLATGPWWARRGTPRDLVLGGAVVAGVLGGMVATLFVELGIVSVLSAAVLGLVAAASAVAGRTWVMVAVSERVAEAPDGRAADFDQGVVLAGCAALLIPAVPVFVFARILVG